nr:MAG TPA: hypothetical protein [Crassvirales sp.]
MIIAIIIYKYVSIYIYIIIASILLTSELVKQAKDPIKQ